MRREPLKKIIQQWEEAKANGVGIETFLQSVFGNKTVLIDSMVVMADERIERCCFCPDMVLQDRRAFCPHANRFCFEIVACGEWEQTLASMSEEIGILNTEPLRPF